MSKCYGCGGTGNDDMDAGMYCQVCDGTGELATSSSQTAHPNSSESIEVMNILKSYADKHSNLEGNHTTGHFDAYRAAKALEALYNQRIAEARKADIERILAASDNEKNKGFSGTWHGDMAAACGEVAVIYKELESTSAGLNTEGGE